MLKNQKKIHNWLILIFICSLPFYIGKILYSQTALQFGQYLIPLHFRVTLTFILAIAVVAFEWMQTKKIDVKRELLLLIIINIGAFVGAPENLKTLPLFLVSTGYLVLWLIQIVALRISLIHLFEDNFLQKWFPIALFIALILESIFVSYQWFTHEPLLPNLFAWIGQPQRFTSPAVWGFAEIPRVYGTTPHPNIFAAILLFLLIVTLSIPRKNNTFVWINTCILLLFVAATLSKIALIAAVPILLLHLFQKEIPRIKTSFLLLSYATLGVLLTGAVAILTPHYPGTVFLETRTELLKLYYEIFNRSSLWSMLFGNGFHMSMSLLLNSYHTLTNSILYRTRLLVEPAHSVFSLIPFELGIFGSLVLGIFLLKQLYLLNKKIPRWTLHALLILIVIFGAFDHLLVY